MFDIQLPAKFGTITQRGKEWFFRVGYMHLSGQGFMGHGPLQCSDIRIIKTSIKTKNDLLT